MGHSTLGGRCGKRSIIDTMMDVEIELRIPTLTIKLEEDKTQRIDNPAVDRYVTINERDALK